jgi:regulatory protein YycI of two-component signal transduction system YycFG
MTSQEGNYNIIKKIFLITLIIVTIILLIYVINKFSSNNNYRNICGGGLKINDSSIRNVSRIQNNSTE